MQQPTLAGDILGGLIHFETESDSLTSPPSEATGYGFTDSQPTAAEDSPGLFPADYHLPSLFFHQSDADVDWRHRGRGQPLYGTSWLNRPMHGGWFVGGLIGDELLDGRVDQGEDLFGGYRLGWDWDHYWGSEVRLAFARPDLADSLSDEQRRISRDWFLDANVAYYPWGDAQWRPYASFGLGVATFRFVDDELILHEDTLLHVPIGGGVKYIVNRWMALRLDVTDNIALGSGGLDTMHNVTYTFGMEAHVGPKSSTMYFPY